ncbi:hypothetical protein GE300_12440 [Rhodobacteraceae bacterium 2CG4]|uniref:Sulfotransferase family protein n=1 Tax=Halovulum marinum TaxID=2662447 RepID=A0A6L5Z1H7_9RHOB|nr:hypothetical protein [Halovulum marinum]MSU90416.1 hypothetical protein [Halovulum marinum]
MRILVHFGQAKTGTTALQHTFGKHRRDLAGRGILYPRLPKVPHNHGLLAIGFKAAETLHPNFLRMFGGDAEAMRAGGEQAWDAVRQQVEQERPELLVLSAEEYFSQLNAEAAERLRSRLEGLGAARADIATCVYLRDPASQLLSLIAQNAVSMMPLSNQLRLHAKGRLAALEATFPAAPTVCAYDRARLAGGDIVQDFVTRFLPEIADLTLTAPQRKNVSLSGEGTAIVLWYRDRLLTERRPDTIHQVRRIRQFLARIEVADGISRKARLRPEVHDAIIRGSEELIWLRDTHGLTYTGIDYATIDGKAPKLPAPTPATIDRFLDLDLDLRDHLLARLVQDLLPEMPAAGIGPRADLDDDSDDAVDAA